MAATATTPSRSPSRPGARPGNATNYEYTKVSVSPTALKIQEVNAATNAALDSATINAPQPVAPVLAGAAVQAVPLLSVVPITGTAPPGSTVGIFFHRRGQVGYTQRRSLTVGADGRFSTSYIAVDAMRYYAAIGNAASAAVLMMIRPVVNGPASRVVPRNSVYTITGTSIPSTTVTIHFHRPGGAPGDYSVLRTVAVASNGTWAKPYVAAADVAFYVTSDVEPVTLTSGKYVILAR